MAANWYCVRQRAGPLVKECRAIRPSFSSADTAEDARDKAELKKSQKSAVCRTQVDRLELRLALFGYTGVHYTLTYDDDFLPRRFNEVRKTIRSFLDRAKRFNDKVPFDYVYAIEGLHGKHRYHVHMVLHEEEFPRAVVKYLWRYGEINDTPVLLDTGGYRRLAEYFNKERPDGDWIPIGRHPWSCSRCLSQKVPEPEKWRDASGIIDIPDNIMWARRGSTENDFGAFYYASYIMENDGNFFKDVAHAHAPARAGTSLEI